MPTFIVFRTLGLVSVGLTILLLSLPAMAWSVWNRETDDSVCDLSPETSYKLAINPFVEAGTLKEDEIYVRLALRKIVQNCKNGQVLVLESPAGDSFDASYFRRAASQVCAVANVQRVAVGTTERPQSFQIKCTIAKIDEARAWLTIAEREKSTETMIVEGAPKQSESNSTADTSSGKKPCNGIPSFATLLLGGGDCR